MNTEYNALLVEVDGPIVEIVFNRPEKRNALNFEMVREFEEVLAQAEVDDSVRVVTLRGAGKVFSAGHDLNDVKELAEYAARGIPHPEVDPLGAPQLMRCWYFSKPLIAGVHGFVGPEAMKTIANFDFVIAASGTRFSYEQARVRSSAPGGNPLVFLLPMRVWKKLLLMGGWFDAEQALSFHFVQRVVSEEELAGEVRAWAEQIATIPSADLQIAKEGIHRQYELMGLANMEMVQNRITKRVESDAGSGAAAGDFWDQLGAGGDGLKKALKDRDAAVDSDISKV
jgi:enoyl-CoA hydratase/carnithine racemase